MPTTKKEDNAQPTTSGKGKAPRKASKLTREAINKLVDEFITASDSRREEIDQSLSEEDLPIFLDKLAELHPDQSVNELT